jgi:rubrerythrin
LLESRAEEEGEMDTDKPSRAEDEYFARQELERRKQWAKEKEKNMASGEKERLKQLHLMKCPKCGMDLATIELHGVKVDQCASCGGIFFDAGEVEQLLNHEKGHGVFSKVFSVFR